jgi:hypothetical protein
MRKIKNIIKTTLLVSTLSLCWLVSSLALEKEVDAVELKQPKSVAKHNAFLEANDVSSFKGFPKETIIHLLDIFDLKRDQKTLLTLMTTCKTFHDFGNLKYEATNQAEHHYPWQDPSLAPSTVYVLNNRLCMILGLYSNIVYYRMGNEYDYTRFRHLCQQFTHSSLFLKVPIPMQYVRILSMDASNKRFATTKISTHYHALSLMDMDKETFRSNLCNLIAQYPTLQNERAIYLHFCQFIDDQITPEQLQSLRATYCYRKLDCSFMRALNPELLVLKETLSTVDTRTNGWKKIMDLDPFVTTAQLNMAADDFFQVGEFADDSDSKVANIAEAAQYYEKGIKLMVVMKQIPTAKQFSSLAMAYLLIADNAADPAIKAVYMAKVANNYRLALEQHEMEADDREVSNRLGMIGRQLAEANISTLP